MDDLAIICGEVIDSDEGSKLNDEAKSNDETNLNDKENNLQNAKFLYLTCYFYQLLQHYWKLLIFTVIWQKIQQNSYINNELRDV